MPNVDSRLAEPVVEIEDTESDNRGSGSRRRDSSHNNAPPSPSLLPIVEEEVKNLSIPKVEITSPPNNSLVSNRQFEIKGSIEYPELIRDIMVRYRGLSEANILVAGEKSVNQAENNFSAMFDHLSYGDYGLSIMFVDINGIEPTGEAAPLKFETIPTISRWSTRVFDEKTAPNYAFKINETDVAEIKYASILNVHHSIKHHVKPLTKMKVTTK